MYYLGVAVTLLFLPLPDKYGRKRSLCYLIPALVLSFTMMIYGTTGWIKAVGCFINGGVRCRYSICLQMCVESSESKYGALASTYIYGIDSGLLCVLYLYLTFV